jgi:hypothetical protein
VAGVVSEVIYSGATTQYRIAVDGAGIWMVVDQNRATHRRVEMGQRVWVV